MNSPKIKNDSLSKYLQLKILRKVPMLSLW